MLVAGVEIVGDPLSNSASETEVRASLASLVARLEDTMERATARRSAILDWVAGKIGDADLDARLGIQGGERVAFALGYLREAARAQSAEDVECALLLHSREPLARDLVPILNELVLAPWHRRHEEAARMLEQLRDPSSCDPLYAAATTRHAYLGHDDSHAFARKCVWALFRIGTEYAMDRLRALTSASDPVVAGYARKRLES